MAVARIALEDAFVLDPEPPHVLAIASLDMADGSAGRYTFALTGRPLRAASAGDGAWRALFSAIAQGRTIPAIPGGRTDPTLPRGRTGPSDEGVATRPGAVTAALVCRPAAGFADLVPEGPGAIPALEERALGVDQSNTSAVLGERVLLKVYRRLETGLNPELELLAFLTEVAGFPAVAPLAGYAEVVSATSGATTLAVAQAYITDAADAFETVAERLTGWLLAPGEVSVEFATEIAADLGTLTGGMHVALGESHGIPEFEPRTATRDELRAWGRMAQRQLGQAMEVTPGAAGLVVRDLAASIAAELTVFEALPAPPLLSRVHGDFHLGQVLIADDGFRIVDFEGEPLRQIEERRAHGSPLRDVASMLRSLDHVGRSAERRAIARNAGPLVAPRLDIRAWIRRAHERFLEGYRQCLREAGSPIVVDPDLLRAFEIEKETYEFVYASTYLPDWLYAPTEGMRALFDRPG